MGIETEVKIEVDDRELEAVRAKLHSLGGRRTLARVEEKNELFDFPDRRLGKQERVLRVRRRGALSRVTFKIKEAEDVTFRTRKELETDVSDAREIRSIFLELGLQAWFRYEKSREIWELGRDALKVKVSLDETAVGRFIELEGDEQAIRKAAEDLDLDPRRFSTTTYIELFQERSPGTSASS